MIAERVDRILIVAVSAVFVLLLLSVNATIRLCGNFIDELMTQTGARDWPEATRQAFAQKIGVSAETDAVIAREVLDPWIDHRPLRLYHLVRASLRRENCEQQALRHRGRYVVRPRTATSYRPPRDVARIWVWLKR